jgi:hypothetical protein
VAHARNVGAEHRGMIQRLVADKELLKQTARLLLVSFQAPPIIAFHCLSGGGTGEIRAIIGVT